MITFSNEAKIHEMHHRIYDLLRPSACATDAYEDAIEAYIDGLVRQTCTTLEHMNFATYLPQVMAERPAPALEHEPAPMQRLFAFWNARSQVFDRMLTKGFEAAPKATDDEETTAIWDHLGLYQNEKESTRSAMLSALFELFYLNGSKNFYACTSAIKRVRARCPNERLLPIQLQDPSDLLPEVKNLEVCQKYLLAEGAKIMRQEMNAQGVDPERLSALNDQNSGLCKRIFGTHEALQELRENHREQTCSEREILRLMRKKHAEALSIADDMLQLSLPAKVLPVEAQDQQRDAIRAQIALQPTRQKPFAFIAAAALVLTLTFAPKQICLQKDGDVDELPSLPIQDEQMTEKRPQDLSTYMRDRTSSIRCLEASKINGGP